MNKNNRRSLQDGGTAYSALSSITTPYDQLAIMQATGKTQDEVAQQYGASPGGFDNNLPDNVVNAADDVAQKVDDATAYLGVASGALAMTGNPLALGFNAIVNGVAAAADMYQLGRAIYEGDQIGIMSNAAESTLSLLGAKQIKTATKTLKNANASLQNAEQAVSRATTRKAVQKAMKSRANARQRVRNSRRQLRAAYVQDIRRSSGIAGYHLLNGEQRIKQFFSGRPQAEPSDNTRTK